MCNMVAVKAYRPSAANVLAAVGKAAAAGVCYLVSPYRTFVAGDVDNLNNILALGLSAHI